MAEYPAFNRSTRVRFSPVLPQTICLGDGIGIRVGLRNQILGVRVSSEAPNRKAKTFCQFTQKVCDG